MEGDAGVAARGSDADASDASSSASNDACGAPDTGTSSRSFFFPPSFARASTSTSTSIESRGSRGFTASAEFSPAPSCAVAPSTSSAPSRALAQRTETRIAPCSASSVADASGAGGASKLSGPRGILFFFTPDGYRSGGKGAPFCSSCSDDLFVGGREGQTEEGTARRAARDLKSRWNLTTRTRGTARKRNGTPGLVARTYLTDIVPTSRGLRARRRCASPRRLRRGFRIFSGKAAFSREFEKVAALTEKKPRLERSSGLGTVKRPRPPRGEPRRGRRDCALFSARTHGGRPLGGRERRARVSRRPGRVLRRGRFRARARGATKTRAGTRGRTLSRFSRPSAHRRRARLAFSVARLPTSR